jgi:outer membrane receptor protein involved in Fe transport
MALCLLAAVALPLPAPGQEDGLDFLLDEPQPTASPQTAPEADGRADTQADTEGDAQKRAAPSATAPPADTRAADDGDAADRDDAQLQTIAVEPLRPQPTPTPPPAHGRQIEEIVVTAQKREQAIQDVPISMSAISGEMLVEQGVTDVREALQLVPNARVDAAGFFAAPRVRGFTFNNNNKAFEPPVGMAIDGIPHTDVPYFTAALFDVSRMEVLRGPQGTSFGKNTTAGLIHLISNGPSETPSGSVSLERGELDRQRIEAAYGGPLIDGVNFRVAGLLDRRDGYIRNTTADVVTTAPDSFKDRDRTGVRAIIGMPDVWGANLELAYEAYDLYDGGAALETISSGPVWQATIRKYDPNADFKAGNWVTSQDLADFRRSQISRYRFKLDKPVGDWTVVALGAHAVLDEELSLDTDFAPAEAINGSGGDHSPLTYAELRTVAPTLDGLLGIGFMPGTTDFLAGVTWGRREILNSHFLFAINNVPFYDLVAAASADAGGNDAAVGGVPLGDLLAQLPVNPTEAAASRDEMDQFFEQHSDDASVYVNLQWQFLPTWGFEFGGRYTTEKKDAFWNNTFTTPPPNASLVAIGTEEFTTTRKRKEQNFQPKVSLNWQPADAFNVFLHWEKGFKGGGFNAFAFREGICDPSNPADTDCGQGLDDDDLVFEQEIATNWGLDFKTKLFDGAANLNVSLFRETAKDFQVLIRENPQGTIGLGTSRVVNAPEALAQGVEADLLWLATDWLTVTLGAGVLDTEFVDFADGECAAGTGNRDQDADGTSDGNPRCDQTGQPFPFAPKFSGALSLRTKWPLTWFGLGGLNFGAGTLIEYESTQLLDVDLTEPKRQDAYWRYKADLGISSSERGWSFRVVGENLTNTVTWVRMGDVFEDVVVGSQNQPRLFYVQFRQEF